MFQIHSASTSDDDIVIADGISFSTVVTDNSPSPTLVTLKSYELNSLPRFKFLDQLFHK